MVHVVVPTSEAIQSFLAQIKFKPEFDGYVGVECEKLVGVAGMPIPIAHRILPQLNQMAWTYELSNCQLEWRAPKPCAPKRLASLYDGMRSGEFEVKAVLRAFGADLMTYEVGPVNMPLDHSPLDPRYKRIAEGLSKEKLLAACQVIGTHVHIGCRDIAHAIRVYNVLREHVSHFASIGDHSEGERFRIYKVVEPNPDPPKISGVDELYELAQKKKFVTNIRDWWCWVRITRYGTVEVRVFGTTDDHDEVMYWVEEVMHVAALAA